MKSTHMKGAWKRAKGKVKEKVGNITGNKNLAAQGVRDQIGDLDKKIGETKNAVRKHLVFLESGGAEPCLFQFLWLNRLSPTFVSSEGET